MRRYKIIVEMSVDAETEADAIWAATTAALSGDAVAACSAESAEAVRSNYAVKGQNAIDIHELARIKCEQEQMVRQKLEHKRGKPRGQGRARPVIATRIGDGEREYYKSASEGAKLTGTTHVSICRVVRRYAHCRTAAGRTWEYAPVENASQIKNNKPITKELQ